MIRPVRKLWLANWWSLNIHTWMKNKRFVVGMNDINKHKNSINISILIVRLFHTSFVLILIQFVHWICFSIVSMINTHRDLTLYLMNLMIIEMNLLFLCKSIGLNIIFFRIIFFKLFNYRIVCFVFEEQ